MSKIREFLRSCGRALRRPSVYIPALLLCASGARAEGTGTVNAAFTTALQSIKDDLTAYSAAIAPWVVDIMMLGLVIVALGLLWRLIKRFFGRA